jgi:hypothetical protein
MIQPCRSNNLQPQRTFASERSSAKIAVVIAWQIGVPASCSPHLDSSLESAHPRKQVTTAARKNLTYHHAAYLRGCISALGGDAVTAVRWLQETVDTGMPIYPAFVRDKCFEPIRQTPQFSKFLADLKPVWEDYERRMR